MLPIRILLIDDHAMLRSGLAMLLRTSIADVEVIEASTLAEVLYADMDTPNVVLLDILLHGLNGLDGLPLLKRKWPRVPVVVLSSDATPETPGRAKAQGAAAFVSKEKTADEILATVRQVLGFAPPPVPSPDAAGVYSAPLLTPRQCEVLNLLGQGLPNKAIGRKLDLSENTVRGHVQAILLALQTSNRSEAVFAARRMGLIR